MLYFCTYFDSNYIVRFLPMYRSLVRHCHEDFTLFVLCFDDGVYATLQAMALNGVRLIPLSEFEAKNGDVAALKTERSRVEYYFTCTPAALLYVFDLDNDIDALTYLDADLFFFSSPEPVFREINSSSVAIVPHRFAARLKAEEVYGIYNVSFVFFRRDEAGIECLKAWRRDCIEWCFDRVEEGKYADQKYLDRWPDTFDGVRVIEHKGANAGPWNIENHNVTTRGQRVLLDGEPLVFYHFEGYRQESESLIDPGIRRYEETIPAGTVRKIHVPYVNEVVKCRRELESLGVDGCSGPGNTRKDADVSEDRLSWFYAFRCFLKGTYVWVWLGRARYCDSAFARRLSLCVDGLLGK